MISMVKDIAQIIQAVATIMAIIVGGSWAYSRFVRGRLGQPHANIDHEVTHRPIGDGNVLLRVKVTIQNVGHSLLKLGESTLRVQQILPLSEEVLGAIKEGQNPIKDGETEVRWALIESRELDLAKRPVKLEPDERDEINYDFFIVGCPQTIKVYSSYSSVTNSLRLSGFKSAHPLAWNRTTIYDFVHSQETTGSFVEQ